MLYKTHVTVTYALALPLLMSTDSLFIGNVVALGIGSVFPDIDHPRSYIGRRLQGVSHIVGKIFGHRGLAHSIVGIFFFLYLSRFILFHLQLPIEWGDWFILGYISHMVEDSFSKTGVAWLQPIYNKRIQFGFKRIFYTTGKFTETVIFLISCGGLVYQLFYF
ncbi:metal-dependent hydrolase [Lacticigenium naphthae]|uniref:metal-dependent hydrolase n=1 Tax=Lacticigenium naphthae TaxID=515351 RepID=UPI0004212C5E|nr:metal-dependent hydrolase [Lacticigenium naphthae]